MLSSSYPYSGQASIQNEIDGGNPIGCYIDWGGGSGHFVAVCGYDIATRDVDVADPMYGSSTIPYTTLLSRYHGNSGNNGNTGQWTYTYLTQ